MLSLRQRILSSTDQDKAFQMIDQAEYAKPTKSLLKWQWKNIHIGNKPNNKEKNPEKEEALMTFRKEILAETNEDKAMQAIESSPYAASTKKGLRTMWRKQHGKSDPKKKKSTERSTTNTTPAAAATSPVPLLQHGAAMTMDLAIAWRDALEQQLKVLNEIIHRYNGAGSNPPPPEDPPCMVCGKDPEGYDLRCGHPVCYPCFQKSGFSMTCTECGATDKCDAPPENQEDDTIAETNDDE